MFDRKYWLLTLVLALVCVISRSDEPPLPKRIIHLRDWHFVARDAFAADVLESDPEATQATIDEQYAEHLRTVEHLQAEQFKYLRGLIKDRGVTVVYCEGVTAPTAADFKALAKSTRAWQEAYSALRKALRSSRIDDGIADAEYSVEQLRRLSLQVGAAGQLYARGELQDIGALDDADAHRNANPVSADGKIRIDDAANRAREDAIVRNILKVDGNVVVIILGGAHDLSDSLKRLAPDVEYERVTLEAYPAK